jgi:hypothetical protein
MKGKIWIYVFVLIMLVCFVNAQPPFQESSAGTLDISFQPTDVFEVGELLQLNFHVFNSTGFKVDNSTTSCEFHLFNDDGTHFIIQDLLFDEVSEDFFINITASNTTDLGIGDYGWLVNCNGTEAGFSAFTITFVEELNESDSSPLHIVVALLGIASIYLLFAFVIKGTGIKEFFLGLAFIQVLLILFFLLQHQMGRTLINLLNINLISSMLIIFGISIVGLWRLMINLITPGKGGEVEEVKWPNR